MIGARNVAADATARDLEKPLRRSDSPTTASWPPPRRDHRHQALETPPRAATGLRSGILPFGWFGGRGADQLMSISTALDHGRIVAGLVKIGS